MNYGTLRRIGAWALLSLTLLLLVSASLQWNTQLAHAAGELEWKGRLEALPAGSRIGEWTVAGRVFVTSASTEFDTDKGDFAVGRCVEVEYVGTTAPFQATKIATKSADDCGGSPTTTVTPEGSRTPAPSVTPNPTGDDDGIEAHGVVDALPSLGFIGLWQISGIRYEVTAETRLRQGDGPLVPGACVELRYVPGSDPRRLLRLESEDRRDCGSSPTPDGTVTATTTPDVTGTPSAAEEFYGTLDSMPDGRIGEWIVNGVAYTATANSEFHEERGAFTIGACVKVHLEGNTTTIREIETASDFRCGAGGGGGSDDDSASGELYGVIQSLPAGLIGEWNIGGLTVAADNNTEFKQRNSNFAVGVTAKIHFSVQANGGFYAREIEAKFANEDDGHDDNGDGSYDGREGHAFGVIERLATELPAIWSISGISYTVNSTTTLAPADTTFTVGQQVRIKYYTDAAQMRIARLIKLSSEDTGADDHSHATLYGFVHQMPPSGFVGTWQVGGSPFVATSATTFNENDGLLGVGAYVKMEYTISEGRNVLHEIEVAVPPGAGDHIAIGAIEDKGALQAAAIHAVTWVIGGTPYTIMPATDLNETQGALVAGQTVFVNSYSAADGTQVATQIRAVTLDQVMFVPLVRR